MQCLGAMRFRRDMQEVMGALVDDPSAAARLRVGVRPPCSVGTLEEDAQGGT